MNPDYIKRKSKDVILFHVGNYLSSTIGMSNAKRGKHLLKIIRQFQADDKKKIQTKKPMADYDWPRHFNKVNESTLE